ncbi:GT4 family glycosyltransferase PelF [Kocuria sp. SM24M-10]|uniref:GT4 family glycosyltransferase PelF n=1 Tax=Kocuria sp. SM24M-10 TaxID=1660349 RepID=UPI001364DD93|nr:GT4 family glycosyltransferase PelF [Kocuria sp. SM24M-10]
MLTEGTYPVTTGGVSTWCDQLVTGMDEHEFEVTAIVATGREPVVWTVPANVRAVRRVPMWADWPTPLRLRTAGRKKAEVLLDTMWDAALGQDVTANHERFGEALRGLTEISATVPIGRLLAAKGSVPALLAAWSSQQVPEGARPLHVGEAVLACGLVDRVLALLDTRLGDVDLVHATGNGPSALVGLAHMWRTGTPGILTEHGVYLRERYLAMSESSLPWSVRRAVMAFTSALCRLAYRQYPKILPVNRFNARWEQLLGATEAQVETIVNGVDPATFTAVDSEPAVPTISFVGRIDPLKDLETLIRAFALVRQEVPAARLRLFGPVQRSNLAYQQHLQTVADELGLGDSLTWEGPSAGSRPAIEAGSIVALSSISEGLPFTVVEAMMCGRATVNTDVGGVSECLDDEQRTGRLVPARNPRAFADACVELLQDDLLRRRTGRLARQHSLAKFDLRVCLDNYRQAYARAAVSEEGLPLTTVGGAHADDGAADMLASPEEHAGLVVVSATRPLSDLDRVG